MPRLLLGVLITTVACADGLQGPVEVVDPNPEPVPASVIQWIHDTAIPIATSDPEGSFDDLEPLKALIGDARVVALGEAARGTKEFLQMKDRLLRFLVQEMDFNVLGIEASMPESRRIDAYVKGQAGDTGELLSGLYFWNWNTREVTDQIEWMRAYNQGVGDASQVSFTGFDMQFPGMAVHNLERFFSRHAADSAAVLSNDFLCMIEFLNGPDGRSAQPFWQTVHPAERDDCRSAIEEGPIGYLTRHEESLAATVPPKDLAQIQQDARLVLQWEAAESIRIGSGRDRFMADNVLWLLDQAGPDAKMVIWAHNVHVSYMDDWQGDFLRDVLGDDFLSLGFLFGQGSFNATTREFSGAYTDVERQEVGAPTSLTYEYRFAATDFPIMALDMRNLDISPGTGDWLAVTRWFRSVGSIYQPTNPDVYFLREDPITDLFDALIYFDVTREASLLPFRFPAAF